MDLTAAAQISATGLKAQSLRMRVIAENLANSDSTARTAGGDPYRRKMVVFRPTHMNGGGDGVEVQSVVRDRAAFERSYQPGSPAADARGYVLKANVNGLVEAADMRSAQRSYEANVNAIEAARAMTLRTIDLIK